MPFCWLHRNLCDANFLYGSNIKACHHISARICHGNVQVDNAEKFSVMSFSGHGGARAAEYVKQNLFSNLIRHPKFISDTKSAIGFSLPKYQYSFCFDNSGNSLFDKLTSWLP